MKTNTIEETIDKTAWIAPIFPMLMLRVMCFFHVTISIVTQCNRNLKVGWLCSSGRHKE